MTCTIVLRNIISAPFVGLVQYSVCRSINININRSTGGMGKGCEVTSGKVYDVAVLPFIYLFISRIFKYCID